MSLPDRSARALLATASQAPPNEVEEETHSEGKVEAALGVGEWYGTTREPVAQQV